MHQRSFSSSILKRLRRHLLKYPTSTSIRASIVVVRPTRARPARPEPTAHPWQRRQPSPSIELPILTPLVRPGSMPIAHAAPPHLPSSRFPPLEVFVRRPPVCATPSARGRHPKTFTEANIEGLRMRRSTLLELSSMELHEIAHVHRYFVGKLAHGIRHAVVTPLPGQLGHGREMLDEVGRASCRERV